MQDYQHGSKQVSEVVWSAGSWILHGRSIHHVDTAEDSNTACLGEFDALIVTDSMCGLVGKLFPYVA